MHRSMIAGQTALITGASSGIGKACAELFASIGVHVIITARRQDRLEKLTQELTDKYKIKCLPFQLDVQKKDAVEKLFDHLEKEKIDVDILVNNAGLALSTDKFQDGKTSDWEIMIDTNLKGLLYVTKAALKNMLKKDHGHIINIGSTAAHGHYISGNVYCATKHAVRAISKSLRLDLMGSSIRVSEIDPGMVHTEFSEVRWKDKERADKFYQNFTPLYAEDIADAVVYCATRPKHVNISEIVVFPQAQASLSDVYRKNQPVNDVFNPK